MDTAPLARKDPAVGELVHRLAGDLGAGSFDVVDHWEDLMAIGLARPGDHDVLVYVAVLIDDEGEVLASEDRYYYESETPSDAEEFGYYVSASGDHVRYDEVAKAVAHHLRIQHRS
jgi:hypothetical protein